MDYWVTGWIDGNYMHIAVYIDGIFVEVTVDRTTGEAADITGSGLSEGWAVSLGDLSIEMTESALLQKWPVFYNGW